MKDKCVHITYKRFCIDCYCKEGNGMANETQVICKNIFKSGNEKDSKEEFTKRWIELQKTCPLKSTGISN